MHLLAPLLLVLGGCAEDRAKTILGLDGDATAGAEVYAANCAACHGEDGTGGTGSDLTAGAIDSEAIVEIVLYGGDGMTAFEDILSDQEIADVVAYVHTLHGM